MNPELPRLVVARRKNAAPITGAANAYRFASQFRTISHFDCGVEAIHVEMDDGARKV
jgi:hypothetical protein